MALSALSVSNLNNVRAKCASLHLNIQDLSSGFAFLSLIKYYIFITTDEIKLLNRANGVAYLTCRPTEVKEVSDEIGEIFQCCRATEVACNSSH